MVNAHGIPGATRASIRRLSQGGGAAKNRALSVAVARLLLALLLCSGSAAAAGTALVLEPTLVGPMLPAEKTALLRAAQDALREQQFDLVAPGDLQTALAGEPQLKDCETELCFERLGRLLASQSVLRVRAKLAQPPGKQKNGDWHLNIELLDVELGSMGARLTEDCTSCTGKQAASQLGDMVKRAVIQTAALPRGILEVRSQPPGATVFVDGTELGITPYKRAAFAGKHKLVLRHTGYRSQQSEVVVDEVQRQRVELTLVPGSDPVNVVVVEKKILVEREKTPVYKKWWFWVAIGGAAAAAAAITAGIVVGTQGSAATDRMLPANTYPFMF
jgi:hypothetical protein